MKKISRVLLALVLSLFMVFATGCIDGIGGGPEYVSVNVTNASEIAGKGSVSWNGGNGGNVVKGSNLTITFIEQEGYEFASVMVNGADKTADVNENNELTLTAVNSSVNLVVEFVQKFVLGITQSTGGVITVDNSSVTLGGIAIYTITANTNYVIDKVMDGATDVTSQLVDGKYTVTNVSANHNVSAIFARVYSVTSSCGENGTIALEKSQVKAGENVTATITPANGYEIASVKVNGVDVTASLVNNVLTLENVSADVVVEATFASLSRFVSIQTPTNGTIVASATEGIVGQTVTLTVTPNAKYELTSLLINGVESKDGLVNGVYTLTLTENVTVSAVFAKIKYAVAIENIENGAIICDKTVAEVDSNVTFTIDPDENYVLESFVVNGVDKTADVVDGQYVHTVDGAVSVSASFVRLYSVTSSCGANGSVNLEKTLVKAGQSVSATITPANGYAISSVKVNGVDYTALVVNNVVTVNNVNANVVIEVAFRSINYTVSVINPVNGTLSASANGGVEGDIIILTVTPNARYELSSLLINGVESKDEIKNGKFYYLTLTENVIVSAKFAKIKYSITIEESANGSVTCADEIVDSGEIAIFTITPDENYVLDKLFINNVEAEVNGNIYYHMVEGNVTVRARFKLNAFNITTESGLNGALTTDCAMQTVGQSVTFTITPDAHYVLESFVVNGEDKTAEVVGGKYSCVVSGAISASASFKLIDYTVEVDATQNGALTANKETATAGEDVIFTIEANAHYEIESFIVNGEDKASEIVDGQYVHTVDGNVVASASFKLIEYSVLGIKTQEGSVVVDKDSATVGEIVTFTLSKNAGFEGYTLVAFKVNGQNKLDEIVNGRYQHEVDGNVEVTEYVLSKIDYLVTAQPCENGEIELSVAGALLNEEIEITLIPDAHYKVDKFIVDDEDKTAELVEGKFVIVMTKNVTVSATFKAIQYSVSIDECENGILTADKDLVTINDVEVIFTIEAYEYYELESLVVNGVDKTAEVVDGQYVHAIDGFIVASASFKLIDYTVEVETSQNGELTTDKETATIGEEVIFTIEADAHYEIESFVVNSEDKTAEVVDGQYVHTVDGNVVASASFKLIDYTVAVEATQNGELTANKETATMGEEVVFTIEANEYYEIASFVVNSEDKTAEVVDGQYVHIVDGNVVASVSFKLIDYAVNVEKIQNGLIEANKSTATIGEEVIFTITPEAHYELDAFIVNGMDMKEELVEGEYSHLISGAVSVSATFKKKIYTLTVSSNEFGIVQIRKAEREEGDEEYVEELSATFDEGIEVVAFANDYCSLEALKLNGEVVAVDEYGKCEITLTQNSIIEAIFAEDIYEITTNIESNGRIELSSSTAKGGQKVTITAIPNAFCKVVSFKVDGEDVEYQESEGNYVYEIDVIGNTAVEVTFEKIKFNVSYIVVGGGSVSVSDGDNGLVQVVGGESVKFTTTTQKGYRAVVVYNGEETVIGTKTLATAYANTEKSSYTISSVESDCTIEIKFVKIHKVSGSFNSDRVTMKINGGYGNAYVLDGKEVEVELDPAPYTKNGVTYFYEVKSMLVGETESKTLLVNNKAKVKIYNDCSITLEMQEVTIKYNLTIEQTENGIIEYEGSTSLSEGDVITINVNAFAHCSLVALFVNDVEVVGFNGGAYQITIPNKDVTVYATFAENVYTVTIPSSVSNGSIQTSVESGNYGDEVTIDVSANEHYLLSTFTVNGEDKIDEIVDGKYTFILDENVNVQVAFAKKVYNVTLTPPYNGSATLSKERGNYGDVITLEITCRTNYETKSLLVNGEEKLSEIRNGKYTFELKGDTYIVVTNGKASFKVTINPVTNGTIIADKTSVEIGETVNFTITPDAHCQLKTFVVNGVDRVAEVEEGTFSMVANSSITISATFSIATYSITTSYDSTKGTISLNKTTAQYNTKVAISVQPKAGYQISSVFINGQAQELTGRDYWSNSGYTVEKDTLVEAVFAEKGVCYFTLPASINKAIVTISDGPYKIGQAVNFTITLAENYTIKYFKINGVDVSSAITVRGNLTYTPTDENVSNYVVEVEAEIKKYSITMTQGAGGSATLMSNIAIYSDEVTITTVPNSGYHLFGAEIRGASYRLEGNNLIIYDFTSDVTVTVLFEQDSNVTTYTGKVLYEDGLAVKGAVVSVSGNGINKTVTTDANGQYSIDLTPSVYTFTIENANGMISSNSTTTASKFSVYEVDAIILTTQKVGVDIGGKYFTSANANVAYSYDDTTKSDKVVITNSGLGESYLDGMFTEEGVVFFSIKNTTDTSIANPENDPGIGFTLKNDYFSIDCHVRSSDTRYLPDRSWAAVHYIQNQSDISYNVRGDGDREKHYFAFAKRGNTIYFLISKDGKYDYQIISSYENDNLNGAFAWSLNMSANMNSYSTVQVELNDFRIYADVDSIKHVLDGNEFVSIESANGSITLGESAYINGKAHRKAIFVPFDGYVLTAVTVNGNNVEFEKTAGGMYQAYLPVSGRVNLVATYGSQDVALEYNTGLEDDTTLTYDTSLFRRNDQVIDGADPGVMWVDPEDDPVYGGYFYVAITGGSSVQEAGQVGAAFTIFRSKDLSNWEHIGAAKDHNGNSMNGQGLELPYESWVYAATWAPELIYETYVGTDGEKHTRYFIYFSANARDGVAGNQVPLSQDQWSQLYLGIGVADAPMGPYKLVETSTYYQFYDKLDLSNADNREQINFYKNEKDVSTRTTNLLGETITAMDPPINFYKNNSELKSTIDAIATKKGLKNGYWPAIDVSPFRDPATGELYLFFSQHTTDLLASGNTIWMMKMKDFITPDYSTMHIVSMPGYTINVTDFKSYYRDDNTNYLTSSEYRNGKISRYTFDGTKKGTGVNEGAHGIAHYDEATGQWLYYLTYSPYGYGARAYSVLQAVATNPMGPYVKIDPASGVSCNGLINYNDKQYGFNLTDPGVTGNSNLDYSQKYEMSASIDYMAGCGHHSFVQAGNEIYIMYHSFPNPVNNDNNDNADGGFMGRRLSVDKVTFKTSPVVTYGDIKSSTNSKTKLPLIYGNGPTYSLQPLPEVASGYGNVSDKAQLAVTGGSGTEYLTDDVHVIHTVYKDWEYQVDNSATLTFDYSSNPQNMRAVMVYNSAQYKYALKSIDSIVLTLVDGREITFADVTNTEENAYDDKQVMRYGGSALVSFEELYVKKVVINVSTAGKYDTSNSTIRIGDVKILARLPGVKASEVSTKATIGNSMLSKSDGSVVFDGKFDDAIYQNKKVYYENMGDFGVTITVGMAKEGFYVGTMINDKHMYSAGNNGETNTKYHGMNRWYKNTYMRVGAYVGSKYDFTANSTKAISISPYSTSGKMNVITEVNVEGEINSGNSKLFATETYFPYSLFKKTASEVEEVKIFVSYQRPLSTTDKNPQTYYVNNASVGYLDGYITFNKDGYVGSGVKDFGSTIFGDSEVGVWTESTTEAGKTYVNESAVESVLYDASAVGENSSYTVKLSKESLNKQGYSGIVVQSSGGSRVFALDQNAKEINLYSFSLDSEKQLVYTKSNYSAPTGYTTLTVVRAGSTMNVLIDGTCVYSETDTIIRGTVQYGLYAYGDKTKIVSPTYSEKISGYKTINTAYAVCDGYSNVRITSNGSQIKIYPTLNSGGRVISSVNVGGTSYTSNLYGLTIPITNDVIVTVTTAKAGTTYTVSGSFTDKGVASYGVVEFISSDKNNVYVTRESGSYSIALPSGTYTVNAKRDFRRVASQSLTVSKATTYNPALYTVYTSSITVGDEVKKSSSIVAYGKDGTSFSMEDRQSGGAIYLNTGKVDNIVIDFTSENFADATFFNSGKYEKDITLNISMYNENGTSTMGVAGGRVRQLPTGKWDSTMYTSNTPVLLVERPMESTQRGVCEPGATFKLRFIKYNDEVYFYGYNPAIESKYKFIGSYKMADYTGTANGDCYYAIGIGTSFVYNKIRVINLSFDTNDANVLAVLNTMPKA